MYKGNGNIKWVKDYEGVDGENGWMMLGFIGGKSNIIVNRGYLLLLRIGLGLISGTEQ